MISLGFDLLANILQTEVGWKLIASHFPNLLDKAIFPALMMNEKDLSEWVEEEDEYIQKNLPSNMVFHLFQRMILLKLCCVLQILSSQAGECNLHTTATYSLKHTR